MPDSKFGWNELIGFREYDVFKRCKCIVTILLLTPLSKVWRNLNTWVSIFFFNCLGLVIFCYLYLQNGVVTRYQILFLSSMQSFPSFILTYISANYMEVTTFVSMQNLMIRNFNLGNQVPTSHGPLRKIWSMFYTVNFLAELF